MPDLELGAQEKLYCNTCKGDTHHELKAVHPREYYETQGQPPNEWLVFWEKFESRFWICCGCDTATLEEAYTNMGMINPHTEAGDRRPASEEVSTTRKEAGGHLS